MPEFVSKYPEFPFLLVGIFMLKTLEWFYQFILGTEKININFLEVLT